MARVNTVRHLVLRVCQELETHLIDVFLQPVILRFRILEFTDHVKTVTYDH